MGVNEDFRNKSFPLFIKDRGLFWNKYDLQIDPNSIAYHGQWTYSRLNDQRYGLYWNKYGFANRSQFDPYHDQHQR